MISWGHFYLAEMVINSIVATAWALASGWNARCDRYFAWPMRWRWLVFNWMGGKAAFFWLLTVAVLLTPQPPPPPVLPNGPVELIFGAFTIAHAWAFWRWLHLPPGLPEHRDVK